MLSLQSSPAEINFQEENEKAYESLLKFVQESLPTDSTTQNTEQKDENDLLDEEHKNVSFKVGFNLKLNY